MVKGLLDTTGIDFPPNVDQTYVRGLQNARGVNFLTLLTQIDARLRAFAATADPLIAALTYFTPNSVADDTNPTAFELEEETEYGLPRSEFAPERAHMLPFRRYAKALGFTEEGLFEANEADILRQIDNILLTFQRGRMLHVLRRLFSDVEEYVDRKTTAVSPGFAGSGTGDNVFGGPFPEGTALPDPYTHYLRDTTANIDVATIAIKDLLARWHSGPFDLIGSQTTVDLLAAETGWVDAGSGLIRLGNDTPEALVDPLRYAGVFDKTIRVWHPRLELGTSSFVAVFKTYGNFDARNPLAIRFDPRFGRGVDVKYRVFFPLDMAIMRARWGVGVNNRVGAGLARLAAAGAYGDVAATIA